MKVIHKTPNKLTVQFCPWFKWMLVSVFNICGTLCLLAILVATWDTFDCNRNLSFPTQGQCTLTYHSWITKSQRSWQLEQIKGVNIETEGFQKNGSPRYRIDLHTTKGIVTIADSASTDRSPEIAEEIRQFLDNAQQASFKKQRDERPYTFFCFILCLAFAGLFNVLGEEVTLEISRYIQQLTLRRRNLLGTRTIAYPLDQIANVIVQKKWGGKFGSMGRLAIVLKDGKKIVVHSYDQYYTEASSYESAALICHFLGL
jgi:hypothetical protein